MYLCSGYNAAKTGASWSQSLGNRRASLVRNTTFFRDNSIRIVYMKAQKRRSVSPAAKPAVAVASDDAIAKRGEFRGIDSKFIVHHFHVFFMVLD